LGTQVFSFGNLFAEDYPYRPCYVHELAPLGIAVARSALKNSSFSAMPVHDLHQMQGILQKDWAGFDETIRDIEGRFIGDPNLPVLLARVSLEKGDVRAAERHYRAAIEAQPARWEPYIALGRILLEDALPGKAAELFMSYPGFRKRTGENPVALANSAYEAGSLFYWSGNLAQAVPLYKIAAELDTGSEGSLASAIRLALIKGDYAFALSTSLGRARRYGSSFAYRDYFGLLHAMGQSKTAWDGFNALIRQIDRPHVWETALVGHRMAGASEAEIAAWVAQDSIRTAGKTYDYGAMYLLRAAFTDRTPSEKFTSELARVERPVRKVAVLQFPAPKYEPVQKELTGRSSVDGQSYRILGPEAERGGSIPGPSPSGNADSARVKSDLAYLAEAYRATRQHDFALARATLDEASNLYDLRNSEVSYMLPYMAFAAARSGNSSSVQRILERFSERQRRFDYHLAQAAIQAVGGNVEAAVQSLHLALYRRPFTENRPLYTEYQFAEMCEWLYEATGNDKYRGLALDWARKNQVVQPWFAWPYAIEAKLSANSKERRRAIAMTYYLDKNSERLASIPAPEVRAAVDEFSSINPFRKAKTPATQDRI
jgi:tetratricopeptide (TPR) repeat protein